MMFEVTFSIHDESVIFTRFMLSLSDTSSHITLHEVGSETRQFSSTDGDVAELLQNCKYLYTASP
jgi:hypothetical protein